MSVMAEIVQQLGGDGFLRQLGQELAVGSVGRTVTSRLCSWDDINEAVVSRRLQWPQLRVFRGGDLVPETEYTTPAVTRRNVAYAKIDYDALQDELAKGATLSIGSVEEMLPGLRRAAEDLSRIMYESVQANAYASWGSASAFGPHWDDHDVIVVQLAGEKHWTVFGPGRKFPMFRDVDLAHQCPDDVRWERVLQAGEVLYLPRGWWHDVAAAGGRSLHLTFSFTRRTLIDYALHIVEQLRSDERMRVDVARFNAEHLTEQQLMVRDVVAKALVGTSLSAFLAYEDAVAPPFGAMSLPWRTDWADGEIPTRVYLRLRSATVTLQDGAVRLVGGRKRLVLSPKLHALLVALIATPDLMYDELRMRSGLDEPTLRSAIRVLVGEGVLAVW